MHGHFVSVIHGYSVCVKHGHLVSDLHDQYHHLKQNYFINLNIL